MASVAIRGITKAFGATQVIHGVDVAIGDGEFVVLVGPSGCGKSTLLRMVAGLETITSGEIAIGGRVVNGLEPKDRDIAMVFQNYALYPHMSVYENMSYGLRISRVPREEIAARVQKAADILELKPYLERKPRALSGGQRQRVAMGRAIVREPKVFLFDEPLSNLDAALRVSTRGEIAALHRRLGATMIYVTHDQVEAMTMGTRICTRSLASRLESGSSKRNTAGSRTMARPMATRWRWPPESSRGRRARNDPSSRIRAARCTRSSICARVRPRMRSP